MQQQQVTISSSFKKQLLYEMFFTTSLELQIWPYNFWQKNISTKPACKMLVKLTTDVSSIIIL